MRSTLPKEINLTRRVVALVALFALMSPLILSARSGQVSALAPGADSSGAGPTPLTPQQAQEAYGEIDMSFEENRGQTADQVKFLARGGGYTLFLTGTEAVFVLARPSDAQTEARRPEQLVAGRVASSAPDVEPSEPPAVLRMKLQGANPRPAVAGLHELEGKVNYFIGNDPEKWHTEIPTFGRVRYEEVYQGVGMVYYGNQRQLEYDFVVAPGADYKQIALKFEGADGVELEAGTGDLLLRVGDQTLRQQKPVVYQEVNGERQQIESGYALKSEGRVEFAVGQYDASKPLVIDPVLAYSTFLGGSGDDSGRGIVVDAAGNAYVTGNTFSTDFPTTGAYQGTYGGGGFDAFVTKLNAAGSALVYSTYVGGSHLDIGSGIAVDAAGNAYVTGYTDSTDFPMAGAFQGTYGGLEDAFVTKLNAAGSALVYSTYLGGDGRDSGNSIAVDAAGNAYVTGHTASTTFPTANAIQGTKGAGADAFVTKLNAAGSALVYSTYLGGDGTDVSIGIAVDGAGSAYVTGYTESTNFPTANAIQGTKGAGSDAFVAKLNAAGSALAYSTYLGASGQDESYGIAADSAGNAYITGGTTSTNFPTTGAYQGASGGGGLDAFVTKFNAAGSALVYSTYLGGSAVDLGSGIAVDSAGNAYVTGLTASTSFPTSGAIQSAYGGGPNDAFVTKLNATGSALVYSTYLGGSGFGPGAGIAVDSAGNAYVTGSASTNFPTTASSFQPTGSGGNDAFIAKLGSFVISGRVIDSSGNGISGVTVTVSGSNSDMTTTAANGNFVFLNTTPVGNFTVTPATAGFTFSPQSFTVNELNGNQFLIFVGTATGATPTPTPTPTPASARIDFEFDEYIAPENCGSLDVAIIRTGDTAAALTVDFSTADGTAKQKSDYTITIGTLSFAPGETRKTITLLITADSYVAGDQYFTLNLSNLVGAATLEEPSRANIIIADDDTTSTNVNPIDDSQTLVRQHYHDFLNRPPDTSGLLFWTNNIESCGANATCREAKRIDTSAAFFFSIEFQATGFYAIRLQRAAFGKRSDTPTTRLTYQDLARDTRQLGDGVIVGQAGADAKLEQNKQAYATQVVGSAAFIARFPTSQTAAQYVDALYASAQVTPTATERSDAITAFGGGGTAGRVAALRKVSDSPSLSNAEFSPAFVLLQFHGYLRRNPTDAPDFNDSGYQFWLNKLNAFGGDFRRADMVKSFILSAEYRQRFGTP